MLEKIDKHILASWSLSLENDVLDAYHGNQSRFEPTGGEHFQLVPGFLLNGHTEEFG